MASSLQVGSFAALLGFSLFWCGITGTVASIAVTGIYRSEDARRRFREAGGTVLSSEVVLSRGSKGRTNYSPRIRTRYTVHGKEYVTERYTLEKLMYGGGEVQTRKIVAFFAPGKEVPVYYDPDRPEVAVLTLETPTRHWFILLFLQPFLGIGVGTLWGLFVYFPERRRLNRFLEQAPAFPWDIPSWGVMKGGGGLLEVEYRPSLLLSVLGIYLIMSFVGTMVVGLGFSGFLDPPGWAVGAGFLTSLGVALIGGPGWVARKRSRLRLDPGSRTLEFTLGPRSRTVGLGEIRAVLVRWPVRKGKKGTNRASPELRARLGSGEELTLHTFYPMADSIQVARKAGEVVARAAGLPLHEE